MFPYPFSSENKQYTRDAEIHQYLHDLTRIPTLSTEATHHLFQQIMDAPSSAQAQAARTTLIEAHLHLVVHLARNYCVPGASLPDLIQEGNLAFVQAMQCFDPEQDHHVWAFAMPSVRAAIVLAASEERACSDPVLTCSSSVLKANRDTMISSYADTIAGR